ncbi:MAG TPA: response regulator transcription factor [Chloroflexota bacterium]|nr:response regulator transcription factor [Chloroflexota bacterium]
MHILVIEDDQRIVEFVQKGLRESGYTVAAANDGEDGFLDALLNDYDLIVLDLMLPTMDGITIARKLRAARKTTPILMLTARDTEQDKILGLDTGADDYLTKPFAFGEFLARVRSLLRRETMSRASVMHVGDLEVDTAARRASRAGRELALSAREYALLVYLAHHAGQVVTRELLAEHVWSDAEVESNVIDVYIRYLRHKVDAPFGRPLIHTVRGVGYTLRAP